MSRAQAMADRERTALAVARMAPADRPVPARGSRWKAILLIAAAGTAIYFLASSPRRAEPPPQQPAPPEPDPEDSDEGRHALLSGGVQAIDRLSAGARVNVTDGHWQGATGTIRRVQYDPSGERPTRSVLVDLDEQATSRP